MDGVPWVVSRYRIIESSLIGYNILSGRKGKMTIAGFRSVMIHIGVPFLSRYI